MNRIYKIMGSISALAGILLLIYTAVCGFIINDSFLNHTNGKYNIYKKLSMTSKDLEKAVHGMISYVKGKIFLIIKKEYDAIRKGIYMAWAILGILVGIIAVMAFIDINFVVTGFHRLFF